MADLPLFIGQHKVAVLDQCRFWADRGLVHCEDARDNSYVVMSVKDALLRAKAISEMVGKSSNDYEFADRREYLQRFVSDMVDVCRKAQEQGMPTDPTARPARKTQVLVPAGPSF